MLLDTHVVLWWFGETGAMSQTAHRALARADRLLISPVTFWEIALLVRRGRVRLDREVATWMNEVLGDDRVQTAALTPHAAADAALLGAGFPDDPADRFLYATAREMLVPLVTKDERLHEFARSARDVKTVW